MKPNKKLTRVDVKKVVASAKKEVWNGTGSFKNFAKDKLDAVSVANKVEKILNSVNKKVEWAKTNPEQRLEYVRDKISKALEKDDRDGDKKKGTPKKVNKRPDKDNDKKPKRPKKKPKPSLPPKTGVNPSPSPSPDPWIPSPGDETDDFEGQLPPIIDETLTPPPPREHESTPSPPVQVKTRWDSRVGYFVTLSDIEWYGETPKIQESPFVDISFLHEQDQHIKLYKGQVWTSDWYDTGVIRGLNIDVVGKHKLNYSKNGDFEI